MPTPNPRSPTSLRIPEELKKWLKHRAVDNNRSLPDEILAICKDLQKKEQAHASKT